LRALLSVALLLGCADQAPIAGPPVLTDLTLQGAALEPAFAPGTQSYAVDTSLLTHEVGLVAKAPSAGAVVRIQGSDGQAIHVEGTSGRDFSATLPLALGHNAFELTVETPAGTGRYAVEVTRAAEPWRRVQLLGLDPPVENAYFGDYLRADSELLYVNASRRGRLYRRSGPTWVYEQQSDELLDIELEWMFEAALSDDVLAFVGQPAGGEETLYVFSHESDEWVLSAEFETGTQGTLRLRGDQLVFVTEDRLEFFRRAAGAWEHVQTLAAPGVDIGFALRPTYFDAPGVALGDGVLVVGAPLESSGEPGVAGSSTEGCGELTVDDCAWESGAAFVYERDAEGTWSETARLKPPALAPALHFGHAAAVDGEWIAVGAPDESSRAPQAGAVFLFRRDTLGIRPSVTVTPSVSREYDYFGDEVVLTGDTLLVAVPGQDSAPGAAPSDASAENSGGVFCFIQEGDVFRELGLHKPPSELAAPFPFPDALQLAGHALAAASNTAPATSPEGELIENAGRVYYLDW